MLENDNISDQSISEDISVDNNKCDPHVDDTFSLAPENNEGK